MGAIERDDYAKLRQLLASNKDKYSISQLAKCLHMASLWGRHDCVSLLLESGALTNIHDINGNTPLIMAVRQEHVGIVKTLIDAKSNVNKATHLAHATPLHFAASNGSVGCARLLVEADADVESQTSSGRTPLMLACRSGHEGAVKLLLRAGAKVDKTDNDRAVALHFAAEENNIECLRHLLNAGADAGLLTKYGDSAVGLAARRGNIEVLEILLGSSNTSPSKTSSRRCNMTPLHWASEGGHLDCVQLLLAQGSSDVNAGTRQQYSRGDFLAAKGTTPLMLASREGFKSIVELLLSEGAEVDRTDRDGMTALLYAVKNDHSACVQALLRARANPDGVPVTPAGGFSMSPILAAISNRCFGVLRALLRANCAINKPGLLRVDGSPVLPVVLVSQQQEDAVQILRLFAIAECQNPDFIQFSTQLIRCHGGGDDDDDDCLTDMLSCTALSSAPTLAFMCRHRIRSILGNGVFYKAFSLPIPNSLRRFLLLNELEDDV